MDKNWEKRFMDWVSQRDDDWWEDQQRISIWDIRVVKEFFDIEKVHAVAEERERIIELAKNKKDDWGELVIYGSEGIIASIEALTPPATEDTSLKAEVKGGK